MAGQAGAYAWAVLVYGAPAVIALPRSLYLATKKYMSTLQLYWPRSRASAYRSQLYEYV